MNVEVRALRSDEYESLMRFLERCYGHSYDFFVRAYPHLYLPGAQSLDRFFIAVEDGAIVSHVGSFPMEVRVGPARVKCAGIGGVATLPEARGRGHMSRLIGEALRQMRRNGEALSILWGDRQRYRHFGYETCGMKAELAFTLRSLEQSGVKAVACKEVSPVDPSVVEHIRKLQPLSYYHVERPRLDLVLSRQGVRAFVCDDGYLLARGESRNLDIAEVVSASGDEPGLVLGALQRSFGSRATIEVGVPGDPAALRLAQAASDWHISPQGMITVVDWPLLAASLKPILEQRAASAKPFAVSVGCERGEGVDWATVSWDGRALKVAPGRSAGEEYKLEAGDLAASLFGGAFAKTGLGPLSALLPVPFHVPGLDHV